MRQYKYFVDGERKLVEITCDYGGCSASIRPNPAIASSGWVKVGGRDEFGNEWESTYCPEHAPATEDRSSVTR